ncbi:D-aminoacylase [Flavihumibacter petaseus NBRC 106054]|uniref:D-aminoacylase n=1 Tax=Flavihumibacter petaseus NBRC 106054 TaxID=1220578 RepID=A0A0E9MUK0_9BACT|nr:D-aminoacylase [Flavihumibacter petaseus NBRC 106054]
MLFLFLASGQLLFGQYDILIINGKIYDGTGNSWYYGDIAVSGGRIQRIGKLTNASAKDTINAKGLAVAPGFIDVHGHIETGIFSQPTADNYIYDGVTTVITGNCGGSESDIGDFFRRVDSLKPSINVASLVGHNTVRNAVMQRENRAPRPEELQAMEKLVDQAMKAGAVGLSTGLIYIPGAYAKTEEVVALARVAGYDNGVYASHIRNEESQAAEAVTEAINIGIEAGIPVQISHFKVSGKANWGNSRQTLDLVKAARSNGYDVTIDQYPYTASSTNLGVRLPDWAFAGGNDSFMARLKDPGTRARIKKEMLQQLADYKYKNYSYAVVANYSADTGYNGKSITEINALKGRKKNRNEEAETILDMMAGGGAQMIYHGMDEGDVKYIMGYPFCMVGADAGVPVPGKGMPHPRAYGSNARVLGKYVREEKVMSLEEAIRRMTSLAARKFHLRNRGLLQEGFAADIVIFDPVTVSDHSVYVQPHQFSSGFTWGSW